MRMLLRPAVVVFLSILAYLIDACVMQYFSISFATGSVSVAMISILTVSYGKKATFFSSMIIGILMEAMLSAVPAFYIVLYPTITLAVAQIFADMSERKREQRERIQINK